jgi:HEAT repeat protein
LTLASETEVVREEAFLPLLHDDDLQVQYLSELALRKRGLKDDDLAMARLISDKNPLTRLRVLHYLARMPEINLREWLRQLSHDPEPAVRAAAVGATALYPHVDMTQRLREMAERDPSDAVRENARYYLQLRSPRTALVD